MQERPCDNSRAFLFWMTDTVLQSELQQRTLRLYGELLCRKEDWAGKLVWVAFDRASSTGLAAAASLAGAASITVDSDAVAMKAHFRDGAFDFVVNTLDEALRTVKNEVRRGRPIAIGLIAPPDAVMREAAERGVAADVVLSTECTFSAADRDIGTGETVHIKAGGLAETSSELKQWLTRKDWYAIELPSLSQEQTKQLNQQVLLKNDVVRRRWLSELPKYQRSVRQGSRWMWLSQEEMLRSIQIRTASSA